MCLTWVKFPHRHASHAVACGYVRQANAFDECGGRQRGQSEAQTDEYLAVASSGDACVDGCVA